MTPSPLPAEPKPAKDLAGSLAVVTGANGGLGWHTARTLAARGAHVLLTGRDDTAGLAALDRIRFQHPGTIVDWVHLDLADLASVRRAARQILAEHPRIDLLVNNAGVMMVPRRLTVDGFETQFGVNHLGHFALTGSLLPGLLAAPTPRVVTVSSQLHREGHLDFADLQGERRYRPQTAYAQSKLANLLFTFELARRVTAAQHPLRSVAAHPGVAATDLGHDASRLFAWGIKLFQLTTQSAADGAASSLFAATSPSVPNGAFVGPDGRGERRGHPHLTTPSPTAQDAQSAARLWQISTELTQVGFDALDAAPPPTT